MAEETKISDAPKQSAKGGGGSGFMIPALLVITLTPVLSFVMLKFMFVPVIKAEISDQGDEAVLAAEGLEAATYDESGTEYSFEMNPLVANVSGVHLVRFVQADLTVYSRNPDLKTLVDRKLARLEDRANTTLRSLTLADYEKSEIKNILRNQFMHDFNHIMGKPVIEEISLKIVIQ